MPCWDVNKSKRKGESKLISFELDDWRIERQTSCM